MATDFSEPSRAAEFYGFVAWTSTSFLFILYILWALLPDEYIVWCGVTYYPNREWAVLVPAWSIVTIILTYITYWALAIRSTPAFDEMRTICDSRSMLPRSDASDVYLEAAESKTVPTLCDVPIGLVNRVLYARKDTPVFVNAQGQ